MKFLVSFNLVSSLIFTELFGNDGLHLCVDYQEGGGRGHVLECKVLVFAAWEELEHSAKAEMSRVQYRD